MKQVLRSTAPFSAVLRGLGRYDTASVPDLVLYYLN